MTKQETTTVDLMKQLDNYIIELPGRPPAMIDRAVADILQIETKELNLAIRRHPERFPMPEFMYVPDNNERLQIAAFYGIQVLTHFPMMLTELGCNMTPTLFRTLVSTELLLKLVRQFVEYKHSVQDPPALPNLTPAQVLHTITGELVKLEQQAAQSAKQISQHDSAIHRIEPKVERYTTFADIIDRKVLALEAEVFKDEKICRTYDNLSMLRESGHMAQLLGVYTQAGKPHAHWFNWLAKKCELIGNPKYGLWSREKDGVKSEWRYYEGAVLYYLDQRFGQFGWELPNCCEATKTRWVTRLAIRPRQTTPSGKELFLSLWNVSAFTRDCEKVPRSIMEATKRDFDKGPHPKVQPSDNRDGWFAVWARMKHDAINAVAAYLFQHDSADRVDEFLKAWDWDVVRGGPRRPAEDVSRVPGVQ